MSNISDRHSVVPFVSGETKALSEQRLAKIGYKDRGKNKAKFTSVAVSVPQIDPAQIQENYNRLLPHFGTFLESVQDSVIRSLYESSDGTLTSVSNDDIGIGACVNFLEAESNGSRLTAEKIREWFSTDLADNMAVWIAEKLGFASDTGDDLSPAQLEVIAKNVHAYRETFATLSGKNVFLDPKKIQSLQNAMSLCAENDADIAQKLVKKLEALSVQAPIAELL
jgi:hypothetical protein